jgi:hypothetical protein
MKKIFPTFLICMCLIWSCQNNNHIELAQKELKDSLLQKFLSIVNTLPYYDTTGLDFKLLRACSVNDTNAIREIVKYFQFQNTKQKWQIDLDSCSKLQIFKDIQADEKYRFEYHGSFCPYKTSTTVVKNNDSIVINTIVYQYAWDTTPCKIIERSSVVIDSLKWEKFVESIERADFWGLKYDNGKHGVDGSVLEVYGFKKGNLYGPAKANVISRWSPGGSIVDCFILLLKYSKTKNGCLRPG